MTPLLFITPKAVTLPTPVVGLGEGESVTEGVESGAVVPPGVGEGVTVDVISTNLLLI